MCLHILNICINKFGLICIKSSYFSVEIPWTDESPDSNDLQRDTISLHKFHIKN